MLYEQARKEGIVLSFDTGPTWANWAAQFAAFKRRYPEVEIVDNHFGSAATVVALEKARNRPQADTAYSFAASGVDAAKKGLVAPFKPVNFDKLPGRRRAGRRWFTIHSLTIAFVVNTKLVKNVPQSWEDLLKPEYRNSIVYLDPRSTGVGEDGVRGELRARRRHEQRSARPRLSRTSCTASGTSSRAGYDAVRAVREGGSRSGSATRMTVGKREVDRWAR